MYSFLPFLGGALIAAGILSAFAPGSDISAGDPPLFLVQGISSGASAAKGGPEPGGVEEKDPGLRGVGDGSTGPTRPNANIADTAKEIQREQRLQQQQKQRSDPLAPVPGAK